MTRSGPSPSRSLLRILLTFFALLLCAACKKEGDTATADPKAGSTEPAAAKTKPFVVGFIYVGPKDDYGYNQAHAEGAAALAKLPGVKIREEENVAGDRSPSRRRWRA